MKKVRRVTHETDVCVVGGGMAGFCAALAAARHGVKAVLMHDRPVLGGNASSECRVHICGADRHNHLKNLRETGILEEVRLANLACNPNRNFSVWDTVLYEKAKFEPNLTLLLNCSCLGAKTEGDRIASVEGWQVTTYTRHVVKAKIFADCSGDGVLAPLTGAEFRVGREAKSEYGESAAPEKADKKTMGMSICFQTRRYDTPQPFRPPSWAYRFRDCAELPYGARGHAYWEMGYWWVELGGEQDSLHDTEAMRDELLKISFGVWDHIKNHCPNREAAANWALDWMQFLPAKRESRRYVGAHVLTQNDIEAEGRFDDVAAYGGWTMDEHPPHGFWGPKRGSPLPSAVHHKTPSPYGIPYRSLYSRNIANLLFAGRCHSASHLGMSSTRVMGTGCSMGQAVGTAAALAARAGVLPRDIGGRMRDLQQTLLADDCYLPRVKHEFPDLTRAAKLTASQGDAESVRDGTDRPVGDARHAWPCKPGDWIAYEFGGTREVKEANLILDSGLHLNVQLSYHQKDDQLTAPPPMLPKAFRVEVLEGGRWQAVHEARDNVQRLVRTAVNRRVEGVRFVLGGTWGGPESAVFAFWAG